jgi:hypothetical protein
MLSAFGWGCVDDVCVCGTESDWSMADGGGRREGGAVGPPDYPHMRGLVVIIIIVIIRLCCLAVREGSGDVLRNV